MKQCITYLLALASMNGVAAFAPSQFALQKQTVSLHAEKMSVSRADFMNGIKSAAVMALMQSVTVSPAFADEIKLESGVSYTVVNAGDGPKPDVGELAAIRFKATFGQTVIDDIFNTPEPYYTRVGSGGLLKGVEQIIPLMRVGDRWLVTIPGDLAFGKKGRPASAGKPRIPADATIAYEVEMVGLPGKEPELIELIGDVE
eukprot:CAMPEP_0116065254 /NCGR_PEP_ID=MMETSP0322-20121206/9638_1 /TAXON_ID=163516 /ORGANISM="Leptocylindrus danicus var. apora, Strain B651" /LENGTH=200 /DNA_ID=CAMNT_0003551503 /DNA_START=74 /DNA_END=676 /DNA_ORIENTATION=+